MSQFPGSTSLPIDSVASSILRTSFLRDPTRNNLRQWLPLYGTAHRAFKYIRRSKGIHARISPRVSNENGLITGDRENWPDGQQRPASERIRYEVVTSSVARRTTDFETGNLAASENPTLLADLAATAAARRYLGKVAEAEGVVTSSGAFDTMTGKVGGHINQSNESNGFIQKLANRAIEDLLIRTRSSARVSDIVAVMGVKTAQAISESSEYLSFVKNHSEARRFVEGDGVGEYGLFSALFRCTVIVHDEVFDTSPAHAETEDNARFAFQDLGTIGGRALNDAIAFVVSPASIRGRSLGDIQAESTNASNSATPVNPGALSAMSEISYEDLSIDTEVDKYNRITKGGVCTDYVMEVTQSAGISVIGSVLG